MANNLWIIVGLGPVLSVGPAVAFAKRRRAWRTAARAAFIRPDGNGPAGVPRGRRRRASTGHAASSMRAYRRTPYNFASSRIRNDAEFEHCLDLATMLGLRIGELSGASIATPRERERIRDQILQSLLPRAASSAALRDRADHACWARPHSPAGEATRHTRPPMSRGCPN